MWRPPFRIRTAPFGGLSVATNATGDIDGENKGCKVYRGLVIVYPLFQALNGSFGLFNQAMSMAPGQARSLRY